MQTCIQIDAVAKRKLKGKEERNLFNANISIRLSDDEAVRWHALFEKAEEVYPRVGNTDVLRELLQLDPPRLLSEADIHYFRTGEKTGIKTQMMVEADTLKEGEYQDLNNEIAYSLAVPPQRKAKR